MINSTSSSDRTPRAESVETSRPKVVLRGSGSDKFTAESSAALRVALNRLPEVRPEVVERGRALAKDPTYPSQDILRQVSERILNSPDHSEE